MTPRRHSPTPPRRPTVAWAAGLGALSIAAILGCGGSSDATLKAIPFSVELGETFSSHQLVASRSTPAPRPDEAEKTPTYIEPYREQARPLQPPFKQPVPPLVEPPTDQLPLIDDQPSRLRLVPPATNEPPLDQAWEDAWSDWPADEATENTASSPGTANPGKANLVTANPATTKQEAARPAPPTFSTPNPAGDGWRPRDIAFDDQPSDEPSANDPPAGETIAATTDPLAESTGRLFAPPAQDALPPPLPIVDTAPSAQQPLAPFWPDPFAADSLAADTLNTESPAVREIGRLMLAPVREAFALGRSGAVYAAREKFEASLRQIADAKDAEAGDDRHLRALTDGLRAFDEARHFLPQGDAVDGDRLNTAAIARSHRTPVLHDADQHAGGKRVLPQQAIAQYHLHAAQRLAEAVKGEQAGSMALFGLGKSYARLANQSDDPLAGRRSLAMYRAAILAHDGNHLAANELGVGLANAGHYQAARRALGRAARRGGGSTVYRNLAVVEQRLGQTRFAQAAGQQAERIAARERSAGEFSRRLGVQWVSPQQFNRAAADTPTPAAAGTPAARPAPPAPPAPTIAVSPRGPWRVAGALNRQPAPALPVASAPIAGPPVAGNRFVGNRNATPVKSQSIAR